MLTNITEVKVRFNEIDSMGILWHGHYVKYFEDGREAFGQQFDLGYFQVYEQGFMIPLISLDCKFKSPIKYGDQVMVKTTFVDSPAAKIIFKYELYNQASGVIYATGSSEQVFLNSDQELHITIPSFFKQWKNSHGIVTSN